MTRVLGQQTERRGAATFHCQRSPTRRPRASGPAVAPDGTVYEHEIVVGRAAFIATDELAMDAIQVAANPTIAFWFEHRLIRTVRMIGRLVGSNPHSRTGTRGSASRRRPAALYSRS
jgi:hypothetical protein